MWFCREISRRRKKLRKGCSAGLKVFKGGWAIWVMMMSSITPGVAWWVESGWWGTAATVNLNICPIGASDWWEFNGFKLWTPAKVLIDSDGIALFHDMVVVRNKTQYLYLPSPADMFWACQLSMHPSLATRCHSKRSHSSGATSRTTWGANWGVLPRATIGGNASSETPADNLHPNHALLHRLGVVE